MIESMTGYGEATVEAAEIRATVSARSVNHRFLEVSMRLPDGLRRHERELAELVRKSVRRGRIELRVDVERLGETPMTVELRTEVLRAYLEALAAARAERLVEGQPTVGELLRLPEVLEVRADRAGDTAAEAEVVLSATEKAIDALVTSRRAEGERLEAALRTVLEQLEERVGAVEREREAVKGALGEKLETRLGELLGEIQVDPGRLAQEVALLVDRTDVTEELDRLRSHLSATRELLGLSIPIGRKLDFLAQEILRELNTVNSKARDTAIAGEVLDAKVLCEQLREHIQNIQ